MDFASALTAILIIVALEAVLSVDNAMVLAVMVRPLPEHLRSRALLYGIIGAYVLRGLALLFATIIIKIWWIQLLGGLYLVYLAVNHIFRHKPASATEQARIQQAAAAGFWRIVIMINVVDLAFAVDSVLAVVAFSREFWVIFAGVAIGILLVRLAAGIMVAVIERYPRLETVAYAVVGGAGLKLTLEGWSHGSEVWLHRPELALHLPQAFFLSVTFAILVLGSLWAFRRSS
ncbi:TerC family protein [Meiothermus cerbereus]|uniref:TerC family protein n=1 Tax=Meiothermus cerbereus TaxID=65552 RepID=UPI003EEE4B4D